jgi:hypothetical protein
MRLFLQATTRIRGRAALNATDILMSTTPRATGTRRGARRGRRGGCAEHYTHTARYRRARHATFNNATAARRHANNTMHSKLLLASTFGAAAAFQAPAASKATTSLKAVYNPSSFDDVQSLPGILEPTGFFDPAGFSEGVSSSELKRYREAELTHGRVAMLATLGFLIGESGFTPLFEGKISGIGINQFWQVPTGFWPVILLFIAVPETFRALRGWMEPTVPENYFQLRPGYTPGDLDFDPLGLKPEDPEALKEMQTKELQHGRLAMLAAAGMIVQELQTGATLF